MRRYREERAVLSGDRPARDAAAAWLERHGLPRRTVESWKYTDLRPLWSGRFGPARTEPADARRRFDTVSDLVGPVDGDTALAVFADGHFVAEASRLPDGFACHAGMSDTGPDAEAGRGVAQADELDGGAAGEDAARHPMVTLNAMLATDGLTVSVPDGVDGGRIVLVTLGAEGVGCHLRHRITLGRGASLQLVEVAAGTGAYLNEGVLEIELATEARLGHVRLQRDALAALSFSTVRTVIAERASYDGFNLALGASLARHEVLATLAGPHAIVHVNGAQLLDGSQVADLTSRIEHDAPHCNSRQTVKNVLLGRARGVFQGKIVVARPAQKTDGYQMNQALLLSEAAEIDAKPELEIYADDVKCSHGATVGALDEEQLFYLRSRGVPLAEARAILVRAFLDDALALVGDEAAREVLERAVENWWTGREATAEAAVERAA
ncbi:MAG: Fe-S cluster assembly protein SufD [Gluconacetobacter diazotrophicus]|nr:Fe-S cluster assembly protein SufD [Gluconacetobacter diazotrophicus]